MLSNHAFVLAAAVSLLTLSMPQPGLADEDVIYEDQVDRDLMEGGEQCLRTRDVRRTQVIHDQAILFYLRGAAIYVNVLPKPCKRLSSEGRFMYETSASRLCRGDLIKILQDSGLGMSTGRACKIGGFHPITEEQV